jgi:glycosyltransferase involved in cell wall biosynthesis
MLITLATRQRGAGLQPELLSMGQRGEDDREIEKEAERHGLPVVRWRMDNRFDLLGGRKLLSYAKEHRFDVVHSHGYKPNILIGLQPRSSKPMAVVSTVHGRTAAVRFSRLRWLQSVDKRMLRRMDAVVFVSRATMNQGAPTGMSQQKSYVIYNGISRVAARGDGAVTPRPSQFFDAEAFDSSTRVIAAVGRMSAEKGYPVLIDAFERIHTASPNCRLVIFGDGPMRTSLERQIAQRGLGESVAMPGFVSPIDPLFAQLDLLVMPSYTEGLPMVLLEAMRSGCSIVATRAGGIPEVLEEYRAATMVSPGDVDALAEAMAVMLESPRHDEDVAVIPDRFTDDAMTTAYTDVYRSAIACVAG